MSNSSAQTAYSITSSDTITLSPTSTVDTFTIDTSSITGGYHNTTIVNSIYYTSPVTISSLTTAQITGISAFDTSAFSFKIPEEW